MFPHRIRSYVTGVGAPPNLDTIVTIVITHSEWIAARGGDPGGRSVPGTRRTLEV
jgi:hypothetical protein